MINKGLATSNWRPRLSLLLHMIAPLLSVPICNKMREQPRVFAKSSQVYIQGDPAEYFHKVISGAACTYRILSDGRRLIDAFYLAGDIFGLEACADYRLSAVALSATRVITTKRRSLDMLLASEGKSSQEIVSALIRALEHAQAHTELLRLSSEERVFAFLLGMAKRVSKPDNFTLRHSDVADYLGLSRESVSRALARLAPKRNAFQERLAKVTPDNVERWVTGPLKGPF